MREKTIAFDRRTLWPDGAGEWPPGRRQTYLLKDDGEQIFSTDDMVWLSATERLPDLPAWRGPVQSLWEDVTAMERFFQPHLASLGATLPIAITVFLTNEADEKHWDGFELKTSIAQLAVRRLGYDVSDRFLLSGLSNCGYNDDERALLKPVWSPHLNHHHLFDDIDHALAFRDITNPRVDEHAPFYVYSLYTLTEV